MFNLENMSLLEPAIPYQNNGCYCGLYCLQYSKLLHSVIDWNNITRDILNGAHNL